MILHRGVKTVQEVCEISAISLRGKVSFAKDITLEKYFHSCQIGAEERRCIMSCVNAKTRKIELQLGEVLG